MALTDLHVHSKYSEHPSEWFLQRLGAAESYTDPLKVYEMCKNNGMDFVTITDHNAIDGSLILRDLYPGEVFTGVEATTYFPEDNCKIHILIFDISEREFNIIQEIRTNIYLLRDYLRDNRIAYSVAHPTYSVNSKLTMTHLEKLLLLFDVFEGINGGRSRSHNATWVNTVKSLTPGKIDQLYGKHKIEPMSSNPWKKGLTGGSDDHAGIFAGKTYTVTECSNIRDYIELLKDKQSYPGGRHNDYQSLAFSVYKIAYDFSKAKNSKLSDSLLNQLSEYVFETKQLSFMERYRIRKLNKNGDTDSIKHKLAKLINSLQADKALPTDVKLNIIFDQIDSISDDFFKNIFINLDKNLQQGDLFKLINSVSATLPGIFLTIPFFTTMKHIAGGRELLEQLNYNFVEPSSSNEKRILWFTDTINDLNGVSATLKTLGWFSYKKDRNIKFVTCIPESEINGTLPPNIINLRYLHEFQIPMYQSLKLRIPTLLNSISKIYEFNPDEIYISTPGPVGLIGLLAAQLLSVKSYGVYHTDFTAQYLKIDDNVAFGNIIESFCRWFYGAVDYIKVPSDEYMSLLLARGYDKKKMSLFKRGIDTNLFYPVENAVEIMKNEYRIPEGINLLYAGRVSKDKSLDFLVELYDHISSKRKDVNLIIAGDGPYLDEMKRKLKGYKRAFVLGEIVREKLPVLYSGSDLFIFPSSTDTFGMVVLEAQACGLPAIVSDVGGPKEIIIKGETGSVCRTENKDSWLKAIETMILLRTTRNDTFQKMRLYSRKQVLDRFCWEAVLENLFHSKKNVVCSVDPYQEDNACQDKQQSAG